jgi:hypothetical protein
VGANNIEITVASNELVVQPSDWWRHPRSSEDISQELIYGDPSVLWRVIKDVASHLKVIYAFGRTSAKQKNLLIFNAKGESGKELVNRSGQKGLEAALVGAQLVGPEMDAPIVREGLLVERLPR